MSTENQPQVETKIHNIQTLRFIAAFWVLFGHLLMEAKKYGLLEGPVFQLIYFFPWGTGVDIFFVISGFIICHVSKSIEPSHEGVRDFMIKRLIRIAPIY
jgi:exopolysaccharide production protein ExoZ